MVLSSLSGITLEPVLLIREDVFSLGFTGESQRDDLGRAEHLEGEIRPVGDHAVDARGDKAHHVRRIVHRPYVDLDAVSVCGAQERRGEHADAALPLGYLERIEFPEEAGRGEAQGGPSDHLRDRAAAAGGGRADVGSRIDGCSDRDPPSRIREARHEHPVSVRGHDPSERHRRGIRLHIDVEAHLGEGIERLSGGEQTAVPSEDVAKLARAA